MRVARYRIHGYSGQVDDEETGRYGRMKKAEHVCETCEDMGNWMGQCLVDDSTKWRTETSEQMCRLQRGGEVNGSCVACLGAFRLSINVLGWN